MKKLLALMVVGLMAGMVIAASETQPKETPPKDAPAAQAGPASQAGQPNRGREGVDRQQMYRQMLARRADTHKLEITELLEIKKIAEEEGATRTVEAIQKMIDKKNTEYQQNIERFETQRRERAEQARQRAERGVPKKAAPPTKAEDKKAE